MARSNILNLIAIILFVQNSCAPSRLTRERENEIIKKEHGYIVFDFSVDVIDKFQQYAKNEKFFLDWEFKLSINNELLFRGSFFQSHDDKKDYKIPVLIGNMEIKYWLKSEGRYYFSYFDIYDYIFTTDKSYWLYSPEKTLKLKVEKDEIKKLKIVNIGKSEWIMACVGGGASWGIAIPFPVVYQEVAFEVEKVEEAKENLNITQ